MSDKKNNKNWFIRHKVLSVIGGLIVLGIIVSAANGGKGTTTTSNGGSSAKSDSAKVAKLNEAAVDGKFEFTVASVECGKSSVGSNPYLQKTAQGQFCLLNMTVKNVGDQSQLFDSSNLYLFDASGAKFSADSQASMYANPEGSTFLNQINPGNSVSGAIVFDVPKDKTPITAELHDSIFSGGVKVNLQ